MRKASPPPASEMTRFGFGFEEFDKLAELMADCILRGKEVGDEVTKLRSGYTRMHYCFDDEKMLNALESFSAKIGL